MQVTFSKNDEVFQVYKNFVFQTDTPKINSDYLKKASLAITQMMFESHDVTRENIIDIVFMSISPLGRMSVSEFQGKDSANDGERTSRKKPLKN